MAVALFLLLLKSFGIFSASFINKLHTKLLTNIKKYYIINFGKTKNRLNINFVLAKSAELAFFALAKSNAKKLVFLYVFCIF